MDSIAFSQALLGNMQKPISIDDMFSSLPKVFYNGKELPDAAYVEDLNVYDCTKPVMAVAESSIFDKSGNLLFRYKPGFPR
jgi:hypothetical protein